MNHELDLTATSAPTIIFFGPGWDYVQGDDDIAPTVRDLLLPRPYWTN